MNEVVAIIPARAGSKGVPDKNIKLLSGKPLIAYSIAVAKRVPAIQRVIVSTDSTQYAEIARQYGAEVPFIRPPELAQDKSGDYEVMIHALDWLEKNEHTIPHHLVHLRPTTPLREAHHISSAIELIKKTPQATSLRSIQEMSETAYKAFEVEKNSLKCIFSHESDVESANRPRNSFPKTYQANGYVDVLRVSYIREYKKLHGNNVLAYVTPHVTEVDASDDFDYLEYEIKKNARIFEHLFG